MTDDLAVKAGRLAAAKAEDVGGFHEMAALIEAGKADTYQSVIDAIAGAREAIAMLSADSVGREQMSAGRELYQACANFVAKVDRGEARSVRSYLEMKAAMERWNSALAAKGGQNG